MRIVKIKNLEQEHPHSSHSKTPEFRSKEQMLESTATFSY
jgi:hypothetical protein